jgi:hypothetical protein
MSSFIHRFHAARSALFVPIAEHLSKYASIPEAEVEFRLKREPILIEQYQRGMEWAARQKNIKLETEVKSLDITLQQSQNKANPKDTLKNLRFTLTGKQISEYCRTDRIPSESAIMYKRTISTDLPYRDIFDIRCSSSIELDMSKEDVEFKTTTEYSTDANQQWAHLLSDMNMTRDTFNWADFYSNEFLRNAFKTYRLKHRHRFLYTPDNQETHDAFYIDFTRVKSSKTELADNGVEYSYPVRDFIDSDIAAQPEKYEIEIELKTTTPQKTANTIRDYIYRVFYMELLPSMTLSPALTVYSTDEEEIVRTVYKTAMRQYAMVAVSQFFVELINRLLKAMERQHRITSEMHTDYVNKALDAIKTYNPIDIDVSAPVLSKEVDTIIGYAVSRNSSMLDRKLKQYQMNTSAIQRQNKFSEFVSPKVVSIQMEHIVPHNLQSIQYNYTVTDKADGLGCLMFSVGDLVWNVMTGGESVPSIDFDKMVERLFDRIPNDVADKVIPAYGELLEDIIIKTYHIVDSNLQVYPTFLPQHRRTYTFNLMNGEYISHKSRDDVIERTRVGFMGIYDCYIFNNQFMMYSPLAPTRIQYARSLVSYVSNAMLELFANTKRQISETLYLQLFMKEFYQTHMGFDIFQASETIWNKYRQGRLINGLSYHLDGLIYTPSELPVGHNQMATSQICMISYGNTWHMNLKWKPPQENTIDFYIQFEKHQLASYNNKSIWVDRVYEKVVQEGTSTKTIRYKKAHLFNGGKAAADSEVLIPVEFRPENEKDSTKGNYEVHLPVQFDTYTGREECYSMDGRRIENESIVEMGYNYNKAIPYESRWFVLRTRYDKTLGYKNGIHERKTILKLLKHFHRGKNISKDQFRILVNAFSIPRENQTYDWMRRNIVALQSKYTKEDDISVSINFGNHTNVAHNIWKSIYEPITEEMICSGKQIPEMSDADITYYEDGAKKAKDKSLTESLQKFHNFVKGHVLLHNAVLYCKNKFGSGTELRLIDFTCGKGGDIHKWNELGISYVLGVDLFSNNIHDKEDGAIKRYTELKEDNRRKQKTTYEADFLVGDSSITWSSADGKRAFPSEDDWKTYKSRSEKKFHIATVMFSLHYFFKNEGTLRSIMTNISEHLEVGGIVVGVCFDGDSIHSLFEGQLERRPVLYEINGRTVCMIVPDYLKTRKNELAKTGEQISVYNYTINKIFPEYLVQRSNLVDAAKQHKMHEITIEERQGTEIPESYTKHPLLNRELVELYETVKKRPLTLDSAEESVSFLNQYFFFVNEGRVVPKKKKVITETARNALITHHKKIVDNISKYEFYDATADNYLFEAVEKDGTPKYKKYNTSVSTFLERYDKEPYIGDAELSKLIEDIRYWKKELENNPYE